MKLWMKIGENGFNYFKLWLVSADNCNKIKNDFGTTKIEYKFLNRETGLVDL